MPTLLYVNSQIKILSHDDLQLEMLDAATTQGICKWGKKETRQITILLLSSKLILSCIN